MTLAGSAERDAHGNVQLSGTGVIGDLLAAQVKSKLKIKRVRADTFGYLQRSFLGVVSDRDAHELARWEKSLCNMRCGTTWTALSSFAALC